MNVINMKQAQRAAMQRKSDNAYALASSVFTAEYAKKAKAEDARLRAAHAKREADARAAEAVRWLEIKAYTVLAVGVVMMFGAACMVLKGLV